MSESDLLSRFEVFLIIVAGVSVFWGTFPGPLGANDLSRFAAAESLVERGTFVIDESPFSQTVDRVMLNGHYLSSKPPVMSTLMAAEYWALKRALGLDFVDPGELKILFKVVTFTFVGIPFIVTCVLFRWGLGWLSAEPLARVTMVFACCFANELPGFAVTLNNHVPGAAILFGAFLISVGLVHGYVKAGRTSFFLAGFLAGLLPTIELPGTVFSVFCWLYLLWRFPRETLVWFTLGALGPLGLHFALTYLSTGSIIPIYMRTDLYQYPGSYWTNPQGIDAMHEPKARYFFHLLFGHHGLFLVWPVFLVSLLGAARAAVTRSYPFRLEVLGIALFSVYSVVFYGLTKHNYGGEAYPVRWFIAFMPALLYIAAIEMRETRGRWKWIVFALLVGISFYSARECAKWPWTGRRIWTRWIFPIEF